MRHKGTMIAIQLTILANSIVLGTEHYDQSSAFISFQEIANIIFTCIFTLEMLLKMLGSGVIPYLFKMPNEFKKVHFGREVSCTKPHVKDYKLKIFNLFDSIVVVLSLIEYAV
jgi:hypothetical protein